MTRPLNIWRHLNAAFLLRAAEFKQFEKGLDPGIRAIVGVLYSNGVETCQSCQGGRGHSYPEPTVDFVGSYGAGWKALSIAQDHALPVCSLQRVWNISNLEPFEVVWRMTFTLPWPRP